MKLIKKFLCGILISLMTLLIIPVVMPINETGYIVEAASIKISKTKYTMNKGQTYTLKISGTKKKVKWSTSNKKVATVSSKGKVTAKKNGTATITAKVGSKNYKCKITVKDPSISKSKIYVEKDYTYTLTVKDTNQKVKWSTSNKKVATVSSNGKVTAKKKGTATITAKVANKSLKCKVNVETTSISKSKITLEKGSTYTLKVNDTKRTVNWSSSNKDIATVSSNGKVTAKKSGTATITAKVGSKKMKCQVTVKGSRYIDNIVISYLETKTSVIALLTNNNSVAISISPDMIFYDEKGNIQSKTSDYNYCFEPKTTIALEFLSFNSSTYEPQAYSSYKIVFNEISKSFYTKHGVKDINISSSQTDGSVVAQLTNISSNKYDTIQIAIVYYDINNKAIGYYYTFAECNNAGATDVIDLYYPYDENYEIIKPANYKIYVNYAYKYE